MTTAFSDFIEPPLAGTVIQMQVPVSIHHTWEMLEEYLVEHLPRNSLTDTFGCELTLINADTQMALQDPIQEDLWKNNHFNLVVHDCFRTMENNKHLQGIDYEDCPKAIRVPVTDFFPRVRTPCGRSAQVIIEGEGSTT